MRREQPRAAVPATTELRSVPAMTAEAKPVGDYLIVVVRHDTTIYRLGLFESEASAVEYAMEHRSSLGLDRCLSWGTEKKPSA